MFQPPFLLPQLTLQSLDASFFKKIAGSALEYRRYADRGLIKKFEGCLAKNIRVDGFRNVPKAPKERLLTEMARHFDCPPGCPVSEAVIALWAASKAELQG